MFNISLRIQNSVLAKLLAKIPKQPPTWHENHDLVNHHSKKNCIISKIQSSTRKDRNKLKRVSNFSTRVKASLE